MLKDFKTVVTVVILDVITIGAAVDVDSLVVIWLMGKGD